MPACVCIIWPSLHLAPPPLGTFFRDFMMDEAVKSIDALSRDQLINMLGLLGLEGLRLPVLLPGRWLLAAGFLPGNICGVVEWV